MSSKTARNYWVWITRPEYYLDEYGNDRSCLEPGTEGVSGDWWTCHKDTRKGDLILLYRSRKKKDIRYLIEAKNDAYKIKNNRYADEKGWDYGCDYRPLYKFSNPLILCDLRECSDLHAWGAYRANFMRRVYEIPKKEWMKLNELIILKNPEYISFFNEI